MKVESHVRATIIRLMRHGSHVCELMSMTLHEFRGRVVYWISKSDASSSILEGCRPMLIAWTSSFGGAGRIVAKTRIRVRISRFAPRCRSTSGRATREKEEGGRCSQELNGFCFIARQYLLVWGRGSNVSAFCNFVDFVLEHAMDC